jgi:hypothetical protein
VLPVLYRKRSWKVRVGVFFWTLEQLRPTMWDAFAHMSHNVHAHLSVGGPLFLVDIAY